MRPKVNTFSLAFGLIVLCWTLVVMGKPKSRTKPSKFKPSELSMWNNCENCHITSSWKKIRPNAKFNHTRTGFPLRGRHKQALCNQCHNETSQRPKAKNKGGSVRGHLARGKKQIRTCESCHKSPHNQTVSRACQQCHNTRTWKRTQAFLAHQRTQFPLTGAHASVNCTACHINKEMNKFRKVSTQCISCHSKEYTSASTHPNHRSAGFSTNCRQCHATYAWKPARINHNLYWPLLGAHQRVNCSSCHQRNRYKDTPKDCMSCHSKDYKRAGHTPSSHSSNCISCHSMNAWKPASFQNHDKFFPISTGNHSGFTCTQCHPTATAKGQFTCLAPCHTKSKMDQEHIGEVAGYVYESRKCLSCHPQGK